MGTDAFSTDVSLLNNHVSRRVLALEEELRRCEEELDQVVRRHRYLIERMTMIRGALFELRELAELKGDSDDGVAG